MLYAILAVLLVILDQLTKFLVRTYIPLGGSVPFIPGLLDITYVQNTGAAFSILEQHTWLLSAVSAVVVLVMSYLIIRHYFDGTLGKIAAMLVLAGGMGNLLDRVIFGYVTDMIRTLFIVFPVFNVADCCITIGAPLLFLYLLLRKDEPAPAEEAPAAAEAAAPAIDTVLETDAPAEPEQESSNG